VLGRAYQRNQNDARVRANFALVLGLQGREAEAETIVKADLPPDQAAAKVTALRQLLSKKQQQRAEK
jgi:Flp pilus assembly protein TadD